MEGVTLLEGREQPNFRKAILQSIETADGFTRLHPDTQPGDMFFLDLSSFTMTEWYNQKHPGIIVPRLAIWGTHMKGMNPSGCMLPYELFKILV